MKRENVFLALMLSVLTINSWAQCTEYKWPQDQPKAEKYSDAFREAVKNHDYKSAIPGIQWMIANAPQWHSDLYVAALETYDNLAEKELDPGTKEGYVDSLFIIYDLRIKNCGEEEYVLNRKAYSARKYYNTDKANAAKSLAIFDKTFEVSGNNVLDNNLIGYIDAIRLNELPEDQIMTRYNKLMEVIDSKIKKAQQQNNKGDIGKYKKVINYIDNRIEKMVKMDCDFLNKYVAPAYKANPSDLRLASKVFSIGVEAKCPNDPTWFAAAEALHKSASDFSVVKELAVAYVKNKEFDKGTALLAEVQAKAKTPAEKGWIGIINGDIEFQKGNKAKARDLYKKVWATVPESQDVYERIGDLYVSSATECTKVPGSAEEKLIYIAAFQMYVKSGNRDKMKMALSEYPTVDDLEKENWKSGESKKIACWIDETVTVKVRKDD